jgi:hypothetical protein
MRINIFLLSTIYIFCSFIDKEHVVNTFENEKIKCIYYTKQNRIDGLYTSYYKNGVKKSEGYFDNGYRKGVWSVWNDKGKLIIKRNYTDPFTFELLYPKTPKDKSIQLLNIPRYKIQYNEQGFVDYYKVKEADVTWHTRIWRFVSSENNPILFENNKLFNLLNQLIQDSSILAYSEDEFFESKSVNLEMKNKEVLGFKIKEDVFFDKDRLVSEIRIIGISPVILDKNEKDTIDYYWVYFPYLRPFFAKEVIKNDELPSTINSLDDLFFYRYFFGRIFKKSSVFDRKSADDINKHLTNVEIEIIESENDAWMHLVPDY